MYINQFPWLKKIYLEIITNYKKNQLHNIILIKSYNIHNTFTTIMEISKWIFCKNKVGIQSCGKCTGCLLIFSKNHPDFYILYQKKNTFIEVDIIKNTIKKILNTSQQYGSKIIWIPSYNKLTIYGINTLLKIIEEPPQDTFFFIGSSINQNIHKTFSSRCVKYKIYPPREDIGLNWIINNINIKKKKKSLIILRNHNNNPELSKKLIENNIFSLRKNFLYNIKCALIKNNYFILLPILSKKNIYIKINWIILLLLDVLKFKKNFFTFLINIDQLQLIQKISKKYTYNFIQIILKSWIKCQNKLIHIQYVNTELLILKELLKWEYNKHSK